MDITPPQMTYHSKSTAIQHNQVHTLMLYSFSTVEITMIFVFVQITMIFVFVQTARPQQCLFSLNIHVHPLPLSNNKQESNQKFALTVLLT